MCPPGSALDSYGECKLCRVEDGYRIDETGRCVCALERGFIIDERGRCICPIQHGYRLTPLGDCVIEPRTPGCIVDGDCADTHYCRKETGKCEAVCVTKNCGRNAECRATHHTAQCYCLEGYPEGDPEIQCSMCHSSHFVPFFP